MRGNGNVTHVKIDLRLNVFQVWRKISIKAPYEIAGLQFSRLSGPFREHSSAVSFPSENGS